jgi:glucose-1-phosphate cytidylyltransferase
MTVAQPSGRFGIVDIDKESNLIKNFYEKPKGDGYWINGGFFVLSPDVIKYISDDKTVWEREPMEQLAEEGSLAAFHHHGFWQPMDTLRDKVYLEELWSSGKAPWKQWE